MRISRSRSVAPLSRLDFTEDILISVVSVLQLLLRLIEKLEIGRAAALSSGLIVQDEETKASQKCVLVEGYLDPFGHFQADRRPPSAKRG